MKKHRILRKLWRVIPAEGLRARYGVDGDTDDQRIKDKAIRYEPTLALWDLVETICHETHHAAFPSTSEEDVTRYNADLCRILRHVLDTEGYQITRKGLQPCESESSATYTCHSNTPSISPSCPTRSSSGE